MSTEVLRKARATSLGRLRRFGTLRWVLTGTEIQREDADGLKWALQDRRVDRIWESRFFRSEVVRRIPFNKPGDFSELLFRLKTLGALACGKFSDPEQIKASRERGIEARNRANIAAEVIRGYVAGKSQFPDFADADLLLKVAAEIEKWPLVYGPLHQEPMDILLNPTLAGQKGGFTAYAINVVDEVLPKDIPNRDATVRDLLALIEVRVKSQLVRSTRLKGRT